MSYEVITDIVVSGTRRTSRSGTEPTDVQFGGSDRGCKAARETCIGGVVGIVNMSPRNFGSDKTCQKRHPARGQKRRDVVEKSEQEEDKQAKKFT